MSLTPAQLAVLGLLADGLSNRQIARQLHLSPSTVANHLTSVYKTLGVSSRIAAAIAYRQHVVPDEEAPSSSPADSPELIGRAALITTARDTLTGGGSVMLRGRPGVGVTALSHAITTAVQGDRPATVVTGLAILRDQPLSAAVVGGVVSPRAPESTPTEALETALASLHDRDDTLIVVDGVEELDNLSTALLVAGVAHGHFNLIICASLATDIRAFHPLLSGGQMVPLHVPPLADTDLIRLAPADTDAALLERVLMVADGSALWLRECLRSGWAYEGHPLPPSLRELADWHLSRLPADVLNVLELATIGRAVRPQVLTAAAGVEAVSLATTGELLRPAGQSVLVRDPVLRARVRERAQLRAPELHGQLMRAGARGAVSESGIPGGRRSGDGPSVDGLPGDGHPGGVLPAPEVLEALVDIAPTEVIAALADRDLHGQDRQSLALCRALLAGPDPRKGIRNLHTLVRDATDTEVLVDAAGLLSTWQAHALRDAPAARETMQSAADRIDDPDLSIRLQARQFIIEIYNPAMAELGPKLPELTAVSTQDIRTQLELAKARVVWQCGQIGQDGQGDGEILLDLLDRAGATSAERWEGMIGQIWRTAFTRGVAPALAQSESELERARRAGDLGAVATWLHTIAWLLERTGHDAAALSFADRAVTALVMIDRFGHQPFAHTTRSRLYARAGDTDRARAELASVTRHGESISSFTTAYGQAEHACSLAEIATADGDADAAAEHLARFAELWRLLDWPAFEVMTVIGSSIAGVPNLPDVMVEATPSEQVLYTVGRVLEGDAAAALAGARKLAAIGWISLATGLLGRRQDLARDPVVAAGVRELLRACASGRSGEPQAGGPEVWTPGA